MHLGIDFFMHFSAKMEPKSIKNPSKTASKTILEAHRVKSWFLNDVWSGITTFAPAEHAENQLQGIQNSSKTLSKRCSKIIKKNTSKIASEAILIRFGAQNANYLAPYPNYLAPYPNYLGPCPNSLRSKTEAKSMKNRSQKGSTFEYLLKPIFSIFSWILVPKWRPKTPWKASFFEGSSFIDFWRMSLTKH